MFNGQIEEELNDILRSIFKDKSYVESKIVERQSKFTAGRNGPINV